MRVMSLAIVVLAVVLQGGGVAAVNPRAVRGNRGQPSDRVRAAI
jgi:hypothetical protein